MRALLVVLGWEWFSFPYSLAFPARDQSFIRDRLEIVPQAKGCSRRRRRGAACRWQEILRKDWVEEVEAA